MRVIITGAGGFIGRHVISHLSNHELVALDISPDNIPDTPNMTKICGDLCDPKILKAAFAQGCDAVIHLATVPGGAAEINPSLAKSVNIDATMALIDMAAKSGNCPRFVFASSIAVFGQLPKATVIDEVPAAPTMLYGAHKLMMENWVATQSRRGAVNGLSLRLPGIVARPKSPSGMKSAFLSDLFHALRDGQNFTMPVSKDATSWLCSVHIAAKNLAHAATGNLPNSVQDSALLIPTLNVKMRDLELEIRRQLNGSKSTILYEADEKLQAIFGAHPTVRTPKSTAIGFSSDNDLEILVGNALTYF